MSSRVLCDFETYLSDAIIPLRFSCLDLNGRPVVLSLWYTMDEGELCCATPSTARVVRYLQNDDRCAFEVASDEAPYCGVRGRGKAKLVPEEGAPILERLLKRYIGDVQHPLSRELLSKRELEMGIRIKPESLTSWDFSQRMKDVPGANPGKPCPGS